MVLLREFQEKYGITNQQAASLCGCSLATVQKWRSGSVPVSMATQKLLTLMDLIYAEKPQELIEFIEKTANSAAANGDDQVASLVDSTGQVLEVIRTQEYLKISQESEYYRIMIETQPDAVSRWLPDTTITYTNKTYRSLFEKMVAI